MSRIQHVGMGQKLHGLPQLMVRHHFIPGVHKAKCFCLCPSTEQAMMFLQASAAA